MSKNRRGTLALERSLPYHADHLSAGARRRISCEPNTRHSGHEPPPGAWTSVRTFVSVTLVTMAWSHSWRRAMNTSARAPCSQETLLGPPLHRRISSVETPGATTAGPSSPAAGAVSSGRAESSGAAPTSTSGAATAEAGAEASAEGKRIHFESFLHHSGHRPPPGTSTSKRTLSLLTFVTRPCSQALQCDTKTSAWAPTCHRDWAAVPPSRLRLPSPCAALSPLMFSIPAASPRCILASTAAPFSPPPVRERLSSMSCPCSRP
mmetsp:Transcript_73221/g.156873  ORF Transcript_73221/g.156873 Transcript_73221/m.156873 type:complete len:264 (+) Transcript_73221:11-802(+)